MSDYATQDVTLTATIIDVLASLNTAQLYYKHNGRMMFTYAYIRGDDLAQSLSEYEGYCVTLSAILVLRDDDVSSIEIYDHHSDGNEVMLNVPSREIIDSISDVASRIVIKEADY